jgi:DNA-binding beta-propeller fold protein YncE
MSSLPTPDLLEYVRFPIIFNMYRNGAVVYNPGDSTGNLPCYGRSRLSMKRLLSITFIICLLSPALDSTEVTTVDFLADSHLSVNAAGPVLVMMDEARGRLIAANTLSSSLTLIECPSGEVRNIPLDGRAYQHLKSESMVIRKSTGHICLIGLRCFYIVDPESGTALTIESDVQLESIAVDETTGNVFLSGRESPALLFYDAARKQLRKLDWLETSESLINLNATPPPPLRKVICDPVLNRIIAVDGYTSTIWLFDSATGESLESRQIPVTDGGRWHLGGYDDGDHRLYLVIETDGRKVIEAAMIDVTGSNDMVTELPGYTEGVGILYNPGRDEVYIPYDNAASVHVVDFGEGGALHEIAIPAYGNDASAFDTGKDLLFIASWAHGEIDVIDLEKRRLKKRHTGLGIIPHMFSMIYDQQRGLLYFPRGASAVNGTFGAAVSVFDPLSGELSKIRTGWAPVDLVENPATGDLVVFSNEDQFAVVEADGSFEIRELPYDYPVCACPSPEGDIYLSYGPHQSYWPTVYIWDARNGILVVDSEDYSFYDRRIPRQALAMTLGPEGKLFFTQNNWGREEQFIGTLIDQVRLYEPGRRLRLKDEVEREITQRILEYDADSGLLYLVRLGERDEDPSILQIVDPVEKEVTARIQLGLTASDLVFDRQAIYVSNFDSRTVSVLDKKGLSAREIATGEGPLRMCVSDGDIFLINHIGGSVQELGGGGKRRDIPFGGRPDNIFDWNGRPVISAHSPDEFRLMSYDPGRGKFKTLLKHEYPYGDTSFDKNNVSFYLRGQFGDAVLDITKAVTGKDGDLRVIDFLSGRMFILKDR